ncbi:MAG: hypothetical protein EA398_06550 [Deltaproteobacteria bacterium]|nr:MAG: hypothetical protein EA398_06550 [Deltaproteobacteria bacterium]
MSILDRLQLLLRSEWSARTSSPAGGREAERLVADARASLAGTIDEERRLRRSYQDALDEVALAEEKAAEAVRSGDDARARAALLDKRRRELDAENIERRMRLQQEQLVQLQQAVDAMQRRLRDRGAASEAPPWRRDLGPAPGPAPPPRGRFEDMGPGHGTGRAPTRPPYGHPSDAWGPPQGPNLDAAAFDRFDEMERRIEADEARFEAGRVLGEGAGGAVAEGLAAPDDDLEARFRRLELEDFKRRNREEDGDDVGGTGGTS